MGNPSEYKAKQKRSFFKLIGYILLFFGTIWTLPACTQSDTMQIPGETHFSRTRFKVALIGDTHFTEPGGYDGSALLVPKADLIVGLGDWVNHGTDSEYQVAAAWAKSLRDPFILVRGNHDNGSWNRHARQVCSMDVAKALQAHSDVEQMAMVEWKPLIWEEVTSPALYFDRQTEWNHVPAAVQKYIVKIRDITPAYYTFDAGGMKFICLDTSMWLLGQDQMQWLKSQVASAKKPIVLIGHHQFLPVGNSNDELQVHERDFLRQLVLQNRNIIAYLHGHAHFGRWWKYGHVNVIGVQGKACRTITFENGKIVESILDNGPPDSPEPFSFHHLYAQCMQPGRVVYMTAHAFTEEQNEQANSQVSCLGWLEPGDEDIELVWSMRLPADMPSVPYHLSFQVRCPSGGRIEVTGSALKRAILKDVTPSPDMQIVTVAIDQLSAGLMQAKLRCSKSWGYAAIPATLEPIN